MNWLGLGSRSQRPGLTPLQKFKAFYDLAKVTGTRWTPQPIPPRPADIGLRLLPTYLPCKQEAVEGAYLADTQGNTERAVKLYSTGLQAIEEALAQPGVQGSGAHAPCSSHATTMQLPHSFPATPMQRPYAAPMQRP